MFKLHPQMLKNTSAWKLLVSYLLISIGYLVITFRLIDHTLNHLSLLHLLKDVLLILVTAALFYLLILRHELSIASANEKLNIQEIEFKELFENASDAIFIFEVLPDGSPNLFNNVNRTACQQLGYSREELLTMSPMDMVDNADLKMMKDYMSNMPIGVPIIRESAHVTKTGQVIPCELSTRCFLFGKKRVVLSIVRYIADRKSTEQQLIKSEKLAVVGELAAGVAHEIRNPLTAMKGFLQLLKEKEGNEHYASIVLEEVDRINKIVTDFLLLAKPQDIKLAPIDLHHTLITVHELLRTQCLISNVQIYYHGHSDEWIINGNEDHLKQVMINLLNNAIEAMSNGGKIQVSIRSLDSKMIQIRIEDQGIGMTQDRINKLGEPFFTTKEKGTGLGLTVSKRIIEAHHGQLLFSSKEGKGTTVDILLPVPT